MNDPSSSCRRSTTQDSSTALRQASAPAWVETRARLFTSPGWRSASSWATSPPSDCPTTCAGDRGDGAEPAGHVVGHVGRRVRTIGPVAPPRVARVEAQGPEPRREMPLRPRERPVVAPQPAQEHERIALGAHFLIVKRTALNDDLGHDQDRQR